ncbi:ribosome biogenesis protein Nop16 [Stachybotrys elegans]|uniref:Nucleolar protein 16 n=1 Tax=Stachybotrys elegans TaxID=80388 RepID=A0A8K0WQH3_9HYPO|nr:ribosome biogenesis protein Nop16 [Stachybotrys elegans]
MGRDLQKKKRRSGRQPIRQANRTKKILNPRGNSIIAKNWDKKETLAQNYQRLGLVARLRAAPGGTETLLSTKAAKTRAPSQRDPFGATTAGESIVSEARVERDADGNIIRVIHARSNPLNDPLSAFDTDSEAGDAQEDEDAEEWGGIDDENATEVVKSLVEESRNPVEKKPRHQSDREREWLESLMAKHGDDVAAMARDRKLNPMQQTAADISKRIKKLNKTA